MTEGLHGAVHGLLEEQHLNLSSQEKSTFITDAAFAIKRNEDFKLD